jgi:hypothetical protein
MDNFQNKAKHVSNKILFKAVTFKNKLLTHTLIYTNFINRGKRKNIRLAAIALSKMKLVLKVLVINLL